ncbi:MAG: SRPBCC domain-containing protein [Vicinamibacterales bacterium]
MQRERIITTSIAADRGEPPHQGARTFKKQGTGEYIEIDRPRRLVFTLSVPRYSQAVDRLTIEIAPLPDGCLLALTDEMAPGMEQHQERAMNGWVTILANLEKILGSLARRRRHVLE